MSWYLFVKWLHILSATILFGTGIGIAFFKWINDRGGEVRAIRLSAATWPVPGHWRRNWACRPSRRWRSTPLRLTWRGAWLNWASIR